MIWWIIFFSLIGTVGTVLAAGVFLFLRKRVKNLISFLVAYASGTLVASALLSLIPEALEESSPGVVFPAVLAGVIFFFVIEKLVVWRHCHDSDCKSHTHAGKMILVGDGFHNFLDGIIIAAAFLNSVSLGIIVSLSILVHEVAQEIGDFALLLHSGYSKRKALIANVLCSLTTLPGALIAYFALAALKHVVPVVMAVSAAGFLYIALADLYPELHEKHGLRHSLQQLGFMALGVATIALVLQFHVH